MLEAAQDVDAVPLATEFQLRILYVSGLPIELQAYVIADPAQIWYQPRLTATQTLHDQDATYNSGG